MKKVFYKSRFVWIPLAAAAFLSLVSFMIMQLWNSILPGVMHVSAVTFWQAMGLFILCKILFGFGRGGRGGAHWFRNHRMQERFKNMSQEEKDRFKQHMQNRMKDFGGRRWGARNWHNDQAGETENPQPAG